MFVTARRSRNDNSQDGGELQIDVEGVFGAAEFNLRCGLPFEQVFSRYQSAAQRPGDRIEREQHVVGQKGEIQQRKSERSGECGETFARADEAEFQQGAAEVEGQLDKDGKKEKNESGNGPIERAAGKNEPSEQEEEKGDRFDQAAPQIVEDLPSRDGVDGVRDEVAGLVGHAAEEPLRNLPVATDPAVLPASVGGVVRRVVVDDFDVGDEAGASVGALDQIVRQESVSREAAIQHFVQDADFIDAFAGEDAFAEEILVDVGDGTRVDIEAGFAGVEGGEARAATQRRR